MWQQPSVCEFARQLAVCIALFCALASSAVAQGSGGNPSGMVPETPAVLRKDYEAALIAWRDAQVREKHPNPKDRYMAGAFIVADAPTSMQVLLDLLKQRAQVIPSHEGSFDLADWSDTPEQLIQITGRPVLLLTEPGLRKATVSVVAELHRDEIVAVLEQRQLVGFLDRPFMPIGNDAGLWIRVSTRDDRNGWIYGAPHNGPELARVVRQASIPTERTPRAKVAEKNGFGNIIFAALGLTFLTWVFLRWIRGESSVDRRRHVALEESRGAAWETDSQSSSVQTSETEADAADASDEPFPIMGPKGSTVYRSTGWLSNEEVGRVDNSGRIYSTTGTFSEEEIGRIDGDGNVYRNTGWFSEEQTHRVDQDGTIYKQSGWFGEERVGRIDDDGTVYKDTGWFSEEAIGNVKSEKDD